MTPAQHLALHAVLRDVAAERHRQHAVHGEQALPFREIHPSSQMARVVSDLEHLARLAQENGAADGVDVIAEEFCEVLRAKSPAERRSELVQLSALCVQAVEAIDRAEQATGEAQ